MILLFISFVLSRDAPRGLSKERAAPCRVLTKLYTLLCAFPVSFLSNMCSVSKTIGWHSWKAFGPNVRCEMSSRTLRMNSRYSALLTTFITTLFAVATVSGMQPLLNSLHHVYILTSAMSSRWFCHRSLQLLDLSFDDKSICGRIDEHACQPGNRGVDKAVIKIGFYINGRKISEAYLMKHKTQRKKNK